MDAVLIGTDWRIQTDDRIGKGRHHRYGQAAKTNLISRLFNELKNRTDFSYMVLRCPFAGQLCICIFRSLQSVDVIDYGVVKGGRDADWHNYEQ